MARPLPSSTMPPEQWARQAPPDLAYHAAMLGELRKIRADQWEAHRRLRSLLVWLIVGIPVLLVIIATLLGALISP